MPISNYDTRPTPPPLFGADRTEKPRYVPPWIAFFTWFFGLAATVGTISWIWYAVDRWIVGVTDQAVSTTTFAEVGIATLAFWLLTVFFAWLPRRR